MNRVFGFLLASIFISCTTPFDKAKSKENSTSDDKKKETAGKEEIFEMPKELKEISGISFYSETEFVAIEDETGDLFFYDITKKEVTEKRKFAGPGDYEDVAVAGDDIYVLESDGRIYEIKNFKSGNAKAEVIKTELSEKNNVEGLAYDAKNNRLLLATKDHGLDKDKEDKDIYAFDLKTKTLNKTAVYALNIENIEAHFKGDAIEEASKSFLKAMGNHNMNEIFRSSAVTIDPKTQNILVLSSINNIIAVLSPEGTILKMISLKGKEFRQPEGISFTPSGNKLYVSNEGRGKKGNVIEIKYEN